MVVKAVVIGQRKHRGAARNNLIGEEEVIVLEIVHARDGDVPRLDVQRIARMRILSAVYNCTCAIRVVGAAVRAEVDGVVRLNRLVRPMWRDGWDRDLFLPSACRP